MEKTIPRILPEHTSPQAVSDCQKCELAGQRTRIIWGEGNPAASLFIILDNPGAREDRSGEPYLCGTRETMQLAAIEAGIELEQLYISYVLKCRPLRAYDKAFARETCQDYLWQQINHVSPKALMVLGNVAVSSAFNDPGAEVKNLRGRVHKISIYPTVVSYHPLAVRRRPNLAGCFAADWQLVAGLLEKVLDG